VIADVYFVAAGLAVPRIENSLTLARTKIDIGAQDKLAGRRHDMLALLIFIYRVGKVIRLFQQNVRQA
jgi:hypothetical protein